MAYKKIVVNLGHDVISLWDQNTKTPNKYEEYKIEENISFSDFNSQGEDSFIIHSREELESLPPNEAFFIKNINKYFSVYDWKLILSDERRLNFIQAIAREFDVLSDKVKDLEKLIDVDNIPQEFLPHLAYLLGHQVIDFNIPSFNMRELIKNLIEIYKIKGTNFAYEIFFGALGFDVEVAELWWENANQEIANSNQKILYLKRWEELKEESKKEIKNRIKRNAVLDYYNNPDLFYKLNKSNYISLRLSRKTKEIGFTQEELSASLDYISFLTPSHINVLNLNLITEILEQFYIRSWDSHYAIWRIHSKPHTEEEINILDFPLPVPRIFSEEYLTGYPFVYDKYRNIHLYYFHDERNIYKNSYHPSYDYFDHYAYNDGYSKTDFYADFLLKYDIDHNKERIKSLINNNILPSLFDGFYSYEVNHLQYISDEDLAILDEFLSRIVEVMKIQFFESPYSLRYSKYAIPLRNPISYNKNFEYENQPLNLNYSGDISISTNFYTPDEYDFWRNPSISQYFPFIVEYLDFAKIQKLNPSTLENFSYTIEEITTEDDIISRPIFRDDFTISDFFYGRSMEYELFREYRTRGEDTTTERSEFSKTETRIDYYWDELDIGMTRYERLSGDLFYAVASSFEDMRITDLFTCRRKFEEINEFYDLLPIIKIYPLAENIEPGEFTNVTSKKYLEPEEIYNIDEYFMAYSVEGNTKTPLL